MLLTKLRKKEKQRNNKSSDRRSSKSNKDEEQNKEQNKNYYGKCEICGGKLIKVREKIIGDTTYFILKCEKCHHEVAREKKEVLGLE